MANKAGFAANAVGNMIAHYTREPDPETGNYKEYPRKEGGGHIDTEKTPHNYSIGECHGAEWVHERLKNVYQRPQDRGKTAVMLDIVVTLPKDEPPENEKEFFRAAYESLCRQFGRENNIVGAWVHLDEAQPHLHFAFLPIAPKHMKSRPEIREGISQTAFFPKKSALRDMHEVLQEDIGAALGHRVAILNGATAGGNKTISELKATTAKVMEEARENFLKLKDLRDSIEKGKSFPFIGSTVYQADGETMKGLLRLAVAGATAGRTEQERRQVVQNAEAKAKQAETERDRAREAAAETRIEARPFLKIPKPLRETAEKKIEYWRQRYRDNGDSMNRDIGKMFLDNNRDFSATVKQARPLLDAMGIPKEQQADHVRGCLRAIKKQAVNYSKAAKEGSQYTPPQRGGGWSPKPSETDFRSPMKAGGAAQTAPIATASLIKSLDGDDMDEIDWEALTPEEIEKLKQERAEKKSWQILL